MVRIVVVGGFRLDLITAVPRLPRPGETVSDGLFQTRPGGKGSNQAVAAARLGAQVTFIGCVGSDPFAPIAYSLWAENDVDTQYVVRSHDSATGTASIVADEQGETLVAVAPGANQTLTPQHIDTTARALAAADLVLAQLEVPLEVVERAFRIARDHGTRTLLNPAPVRGNLYPLLALSDVVTPNQAEAATLGSALVGKEVVTTLGARGAIWRRGASSGTVPAFKVQVVDPVGGGDAFNAGMALALAEGQALEKAVRFANAVAALAVTKLGAATSMPTRDDVTTFLEASGVLL